MTRSRTVRLAAAVALTGAAASLSPVMASADSGIQAGSLVCKGEGGWGDIITSEKTFDCVFASAEGGVRGKYTGVIRKYGLDVGKTGNTTLTWLVFGPAEKVGENYTEGSLAGTYGGVGAEVTAAVGIGANALVGAGEASFALQPISVQVQTGLSVAAAVQTLELTYLGPLE